MARGEGRAAVAPGALARLIGLAMERGSLRRRAAVGLAFGLLSLVAVLPAQALELRVLSAGAVEPGIRRALAAFERASGHTTRIEFAAAPVLRTKVAGAPSADVVVLTQGIVDELAAQGTALGPRAPIGRVGVGIAVRPGADTPDIASTESLKAALAGADSVVFNRASSGLYVERMLQQIGMADVVNAKATREQDGAAVMKRLLAGTARREFGFGATTEILLFRDQGLKLVGPLPTALQNYTAYVALAWPGASAAEPARAEAVAALIRHLQSPETRALFANAGIEPTP
jgi:molybdate transport system substrate-binding protein